MINKSHPLTKAQKRIWFESQTDSSRALNIALVYELQGTVNRQALNQAMSVIVKKHEMFRSTFSEVNNHLERVVNETIEGRVEYVEFKKPTDQSEIFSLLARLIAEPLPLAIGPLFQFFLIQKNEKFYYLIMIVHPIIMGRSSLKSFVTEISNYYNQITSGQVIGEVPIIDSSEYLKKEKAFNDTPLYKDGVAYWANILKANHFELTLPEKGFYRYPLLEQHRVPFKIGETESNQIREMAKCLETNLFVVFMAAYQAVLYRYSDTNDIIVNFSTPITYQGQKSEGFEPTDNSLSLRSLFHPGITFLELIQGVKKQWEYSGYFHGIQTNDIVRAIRNRFDYYFQGIFSNVALEKKYLPFASLNLSQVQARLLPDFSHKLSKEKLVLYYNEDAASIVCMLEVDETLDSTSVKNFSDHFLSLLGQMLGFPEKPIDSFDILSKEERQKMNLTVKDIFEWRTVKKMAELLVERSSEGRTLFDITRAKDKQKYYPLSFSQQRLWYLYQFDKKSAFYNIPFKIEFSGKIDLILLVKTIHEVVKRHENFRTLFVEIDGEVRQQILPFIQFNIPIFKKDFHTERHLLELGREAFDLSKAPLFRFALIKESLGKTALFFTIHHMVFDGWSMRLFLKEMRSIYSALSHQTQGLSSDSALGIRYVDFSQSQKKWFEEELFENQLSYWQKKLEGPLPILEIPTDFPRPKKQSFIGETISFDIPESLGRSLRVLALKNKTTLFVTLLAAYKVLLYRYTRQNEIIVGVPMANRNYEAVEDIMGFFVNTVAFRTRLDGDVTFDNLLAKLNEISVEANENQDLPFSLLVKKLMVQRDSQHPPVFQTMFVLQNELDYEGVWSESDIYYKIGDLYDTGTSKFDITLSVNELQGDALRGQIEYCTDLFTRESIHNMVNHYLRSLDSVVLNPKLPIADLSVLTFAESQKIIVDWNQTRVDYPQGKLLHQLFEDKVKETPEETAVISGDLKLTYRELNHQANEIAIWLHQQYQGVHRQSLMPDTLVGICVQRGIVLIKAILGILKAGLAYLPLDPKYSDKRLQYMIQDSRCPLILTQNEFKEKLEKLSFSLGDKLVCLDLDQELPKLDIPTQIPCRATSKNLAYVIYTSGSTGFPKGVMIEHKSICDRLYALTDIYEMISKDHCLHYSSYSFDASIIELLLPLSVGAQLVIAPSKSYIDPGMLFDLIVQHKITFSFFSPALLEVFLEWLNDRQKRQCQSLKKVAVGGEALRLNTMKKFFQCFSKAKLHNSYGPTENTIVTASWNSDRDSQRISIGKPIANTTGYVLDEHLNPVSVGVLGELYTGGIGVARGYLNNPLLTIQKFVANPFSNDPQDRLYRTGDIVRWLPNGELEFIGRKDNQVKIRGFRIELGEIEAVLSQHEGIQQAVVIVKTMSEQKWLVAYYVKNPIASVSSGGLQEYLNRQLPAYMVPSFFIEIDAIPLTSNGKVDHNVLPDINQNNEHPGTPPQTDTEEKLAKIWRAILKTDRIAREDNFFQLGGDSLSLVRVMASVKKQWDRDVSLAVLLENPTIEWLGVILDGKTSKPFSENNLTLAMQEANQPLHIPVPLPLLKAKEKRCIFLTGVTGFLGAYLLERLLLETTATIYCLVRGVSPEEIKEKFSRTLSQYQLSRHLKNPRIQLLQGDLASENLGMSPEHYDRVVQTVDALYHVGARVHHVYDYQMLKAENVNSTIELIRIAATNKLKPIHYISTISAASVVDKKNALLEVGPSDHPPGSNGYVLTKWVSEKLLWQAKEKGLSVTIYRPGNIAGHSKTGLSNFENNHALLLLKGCIQLGVAPSWDMAIEMVPVDYLSQAIVSLSLQDTSAGKIYHLSNPHLLLWRTYINEVDALGYHINLISPVLWNQRYLPKVKKDNALYALKAFYSGPENTEQDDMRRVCCRHTTNALSRLGIAFPKNYKALIACYLKCLKRLHFW